MLVFFLTCYILIQRVLTQKIKISGKLKNDSGNENKYFFYYLRKGFLTIYWNLLFHVIHLKYLKYPYLKGIAFFTIILFFNENLNEIMKNFVSIRNFAARTWARLHCPCYSQGLVSCIYELKEPLYVPERFILLRTEVTSENLFQFRKVRIFFRELKEYF